MVFDCVTNFLTVNRGEFEQISGGLKMTATHKTDTGQGEAFAGVDTVEIKVTIRPDQELKALRALELNEDSAEVRIIYFYDTANLDFGCRASWPPGQGG